MKQRMVKQIIKIVAPAFFKILSCGHHNTKYQTGNE
jgi:hypothetical protein